MSHRPPRRSAFSALSAFVLVVALAGAAAEARAQARPIEVRSGQRVRIRTADGDRYETRWDAGPDGAPEPWVDSLWVRGNAAATGAIVVGVIAGAGSFAFWSWFCSEWYRYEGGCQKWATVTGVSFATGAIGALVGAGIGLAIPKWRLRYVRDPESPLSLILEPGRVGMSLRL